MLFPAKFKASEHISPIKVSDISSVGSPTIQNWIHLCQLTQKDLEALKKIDDLMETHAAAIADRHYQMIMDIPHIKEIFNTYSEYVRYTTLITKYYKQLTKPALNEEYSVLP